MQSIILGAPPPPPAKSPSRWLNRLFWLLVVCALVLAVLLFRREILTAMARAWIVSDPPAKADAILVLGGKVDVRPFAAAEEYQQGLAPLVLVTQPELTRTAKLELAPAETAVACMVLLQGGVPPEALRIVGTNLTTTAAEAEAVRAWITNTPSTPIHSILIPTDPFNARRVRRLFTHALRGTGVRVSVTSIDMKRYRAENWWKDEQGAKDFVSEVAKYIHGITHN